jgi:type IV pilus modification protein PilV
LKNGFGIGARTNIQDQSMMRQKGYTLIELMTTLAVAAVLISVAMPGMNSFRQNSQLTGTANELISAMHLARNTAVTTNTRVTLCASSNGEDCEAVAWDEGWIAFVDRDSDQNVDDDETVLRAGAGDEALDISSGQYPTRNAQRGQREHRSIQHLRPPWRGSCQGGHSGPVRPAASRRQRLFRCHSELRFLGSYLLMNFLNRQRGFSLIELLVAMVIFTIGLVSIAGLQMVAKKSNYESLQRTTASHIAYGLLEEMRTNGEAIGTYLAAPDLGGGQYAALPVSDCNNVAAPCTASQKAIHDLWFWEQVLDGEQEVGVAGASGGILTPTLCIEGPVGGNAGMYEIAIAWRGAISLENAGIDDCGAGTGKYGDGDAYRRVLRVSTFIDPNI